MQHFANATVCSWPEFRPSSAHVHLTSSRRWRQQTEKTLGSGGNCVLLLVVQRIRKHWVSFTDDAEVVKQLWHLGKNGCCCLTFRWTFLPVCTTDTQISTGKLGSSVITLPSHSSNSGLTECSVCWCVLSWLVRICEVSRGSFVGSQS